MPNNHPVPSIEIVSLKKGFLVGAAEAIHVVVRFVAPARPAPAAGETVAERAPLDLAIVIDRSGSMSGSPLQAAIESTVRIISGLRPTDRISVVTFDDSIDVVQPLVEAVNTQKLIENVRQISSGGSTNLFGGWQEGVKQLAPFVKKDRISRVILLSDGQANQGLVVESDIFAEVAKAAGAGITTSTVGLGHGFNESLLSGMAKSGEGNANFGQTADDLDESFEEQFAILSNAMVRNVEIKIQGGAGVQARLVGEILEEGTAHSTRKLGTLPWDSALTAVVELKIGAGANADSLLAVNFKAKNIAGESLKFGPVILSLPAVDLATFSVLPSDPNILIMVSDALVGEKLEYIESLVRAGDIRKAKAELKNLQKTKDLSDWAKNKLVYIENLLENDAVMSAKEMRYGRAHMSRTLSARAIDDYEVELQNMPLYMLKKIAAGRRASGQPNTPPPQQPPQQPPQA